MRQDEGAGECKIGMKGVRKGRKGEGSGWVAGGRKGGERKRETGETGVRKTNGGHEGG